jgi:hypothetical protein
MTCPTCGQAAQGAERFCTNCGSDLTATMAALAATPLAGAAAPATYAPAPPAATAANNLRGVRGWLLFFCVYITILGPFFGLSALGFLRYSGESLNLLLSLGLTLLAIITGILLWIVSPQALPMLRIYFALVLAVAVWGFISYLRVPHMGVFLPQLILAWGRTALFLAIWITYFRRSKRVLATYGQNL